MKNLRCIIVDDVFPIAEGVKKVLLDSNLDFKQIDCFTSVIEAFDELNRSKSDDNPVDLIITDLEFRSRDVIELQGIDLIRRNGQERYGKLLVVSNKEDYSIIQSALESKANGYLRKGPKNKDQIVEAVTMILQGDQYLCSETSRLIKYNMGYHKPMPRHLKELKMLSNGWKIKEIAENLDISVKLVEFDLRSLRAELSDTDDPLINVTHLVATALRKNVIR